MQIKIKKLHSAAIIPKYATDGSACFDLHAVTVKGAQIIGALCNHGEPVVCGTGLSFQIPAGHVMLIFSRSGHGFNNEIRLANCVGVIDSDYRGEVMVKLTKDYHWKDDNQPAPIVRPGDRIAQAMVVAYPRVEFVEADLSDTKRGAGGFGSTGE